MPGRHQIPANILPSPHQIPRRLRLRVRHRDRDDLTQMQQPSQMPSITSVGLHPIPAGPLQLRRRCDLTVNTGNDQEPGQPETCRTGLIRHRHRARQRPHPRQHTTMLRRQPPLEQLPGLTVQPARHHRPRVHIQPDTRTLTSHWGLPHLWLYRPGPPSPATHDYM